MTKLKMPLLLPIAMIAVGVVLMAYMVNVESEPGAIPLLMIAGGTGWFFIAPHRTRSRHR